MKGSDSDTKLKILDASIDLFHKDGFAKASTRDIARTADITLSTSYNHFSNKHDILYTIIMQIGCDLLEQMDAATDNMAPGVEALRALMISQLCLIEQRAKEIKIYLEEQYQLPPDLRAIVLAQHKRVYNRYYEQICAIEQQGLLTDINKTVVTFSILAMLNWAYRWYRAEGPLSMEQIADDIIKLCFGGILRQPAP